MKRYLVSVILLIAFVVTKSWSQTVYYYYDAAGNRIEKTIYLENSKGSQKEKPEIKNPAKAIEDNTIIGQKIKIYPNPTEGLVTIEVPENMESNSELRIIVTDSNGKVIVDRPHEGLRTEVNLSDKPNGLYILTLRQGSVSSKWKLIKR
jgi:hypothetical protein